VRLVSVVGTRPQLIKAAALLPAIRARHDEVFVDTGQHWDEAMAGAFFAELGLPRPDHSLGIGGGGQAEQTARMLTALEPILVAERPDAVLVYGDTNSTLAGALAAAKVSLPVAHVEAGLRSFDRTMPEEVNRVVADHLSSWLFAPTPTAVANLAAEGIADGVTLVGDVLQDLAARTRRRSPIRRSSSGSRPRCGPSRPASGCGPAATSSRRFTARRTATRRRSGPGPTCWGRLPASAGRSCFRSTRELLGPWPRPGSRWHRRSTSSGRWDTARRSRSSSTRRRS
jgi:hypothetical protein